jgi:ribosome-associated protein
MKYQISRSISIDDDHISFEFVRAEGPGGQNVNKLSTAVELRFNLVSAGLSEAIQERFARLAGRRLTQDGVMIIKAQRFRSQERNREDALERLFALIREAAIPPIPRRPSKPTKGSKERRLESKRQNQATKQGRRPIKGDD